MKYRSALRSVGEVRLRGDGEVRLGGLGEVGLKDVFLSQLGVLSVLCVLSFLPGEGQAKHGVLVVVGTVTGTVTAIKVELVGTYCEGIYGRGTAIKVEVVGAYCEGMYRLGTANEVVVVGKYCESI